MKEGLTMANRCNFSMVVIGAEKNIKKFYNAITQKGLVWIGRGSCADIWFDENYEENQNKKVSRAEINGWLKNSVQSSLIDNAVSMQHQKETGDGHWSNIKQGDKKEFITLFEACRKFNLDMEVYSSEIECEFQEHYLFKSGKIECDECVDYYEHYLNKFDTKKEAESALGIQFSDIAWKNKDFITMKCGGFENFEKFVI